MYPFKSPLANAVERLDLEADQREREFEQAPEGGARLAAFAALEVAVLRLGDARRRLEQQKNGR